MMQTDDHVALPEAPEGTCVPVARESKRWWCRGSHGWHLVNPETGACTCHASRFRPRAMCKHAEYLRVVVQAQRALAEVSPTVVEREAA